MVLESSVIRGSKFSYQLFRCQLGLRLGREVIWRHDATNRLATNFPSSPLRSDGRAPMPRFARVRDNRKLQGFSHDCLGGQGSPAMLQCQRDEAGKAALTPSAGGLDRGSARDNSYSTQSGFKHVNCGSFRKAPRSAQSRFPGGTSRSFFGASARSMARSTSAAASDLVAAWPAITTPAIDADHFHKCRPMPIRCPDISS